MAELGLGQALGEEDAKLKGDGIKAAGKHDPRAAGLGRRLMGADHGVHPGGLARQVQIIGPRRRAGCNKVRTVKLIRPNRGEHRLGGLHHGLDRGRVPGVSDDQRRLRRGADLIAHLGQLVGRAAGHGPLDLAANPIGLRQIFRHQPPGKSGRAVNDDVEFCLGVHESLSSS